MLYTPISVPNWARASGIYRVDRDGILSGYALLNLPSSGSVRALVRVNIRGTVAVNPDGTGKASYEGTLPNGTKLPVDEDFVITRAQGRSDGNLALDVFNQRGQASVLLGLPGSHEVTVIWNRLPDENAR
ncbi:MAG: hypothetical protein M3Y72_15820 [Acidobacteriota bacterium]|nr:hypothetical protein [Acidobacteriota bacterium]